MGPFAHSVPTLKDRIVQQALRRLMEPIFEADVYTYSHGFRRHRSRHTALRDVARMFPRTTWTNEVDIMGCFDHISHGRLMRAVQPRMADEKVLKIIRAFLVAGYLEQWQYHRTYSGIPQGGVLTLPTINVAKNVVEFSTSIPREQLRPGYGAGFLDAPLQMVKPDDIPTERERGGRQGTSRTASDQGAGGQRHM
jgi:RNA-directed DNA polymerase